MLASVSIPVFNSSPSSSPEVIPRNKKRTRFTLNGRLYGKEPLPVGPSEDSPRNAQIVSRNLNDYGSFYTLRIGDAEINEVCVDEILDYVSAQHLEAFENQQFQEEAELQRIVIAEEERIEREQAERRRERAKRNVTVQYRDAQVSAEASDAAQILGKHGRPRPDYSAHFKKISERRRRKRNPASGELMPLSDEDGIADSDSSVDEPVMPASSRPSLFTSLEQPKRRRRKRNKLTGELLPLSPTMNSHSFDKKSRQRRKRHPRTGQLMPFGWQYEPDSMEERGSAALGVMLPAVNRLNLSQEHPSKRMKLSSRSSSGSPGMILEVRKQSAETSDEDGQSQGSDDGSEAAVHGFGVKSPPSASRGQLAVPATLQTQFSSARESMSSPEPNTMTSMLRGLTSNAITLEDDDEHDGELGEDEWFIEAILGHKMSDPRTHRPEYGTRPVMLYHVKWEGFDELTWEPIESFPDRGVVEDYERRFPAQAALPDKHVQDTNILLASSTKRTTNAPTAVASSAQTFRSSQMQADEADGDGTDEEEEDSWEVEKILAHHLSDPRTHRPEQGTKPVLLYQVKWRGYSNPSWEPLSSFSDRAMVDAYRRQAGLSTKRYEGS